MARQSDSYTQKFLADNYALIVNVSKALSRQYEDLAHDVCIEITKCTDCLKRVTNVKSYIFISARNIMVKQALKHHDIESESEPHYTPDELTHHTIQADYYNHSGLTSEDKFLLDLYMDNDCEFKKTAAAIHMDRNQVATKIQKICTKLRSLD
jgi:DNA-directed RNA polymerase specialized sigma24 family protein